MDTELARTFLKIVETGSFIKAAEQLFVTQAAVSRRIKVLEADLGCSLFVRNKAGAVLTSPGRRFARHAAKLLHTLEQARHEVGVSSPFDQYLAIGGRLGLWEGFLLQVVPLLRERAPGVVLRTQIGFEADLTQQIIDGSLDIAVMYTPRAWPGFEIETLFEDDLVLVTSEADRAVSPASYVQVEWGPEFQQRQRMTQPQLANPGVVAGVGWLGLQQVLDRGGSVYLPWRLARPYLEDRRLHLAADFQRFTLPAYLVYRAEQDRELLGLIRDCMRQVTADNGMNSQLRVDIIP